MPLSNPHTARSAGAALLALCASLYALPANAQPVEVWRNNSDWRQSNHLWRNYNQSRQPQALITDLSFLRLDTAEGGDLRGEAWQREADYRAALADPRKRLAYARQHGAKDKGRGHYMTAACYLQGDCGEPADLAQALAAARRGAEAGHARSMTLLAEAQMLGRGVPANPAQALQGFRRAAEAGDRRAWFKLGQSAFRGQGMPQDFAQAREWLQKAGDDPEAWGLLGVLHGRGLGGPEDAALEARYLRQAAEAGDLLGRAQYGELLFHGSDEVEPDRAAARPHLQAAAEAGLASSMALWADLLRKGEHVAGGSPQPAQARAMLEAAAAQGNDGALFDLGLAQATGQLGYTADAEAGRRLMAKAADAGSRPALDWLTHHHHSAGQGTEARRYNDKAVLAGTARGYFNRGMAELEGFWGLAADQPTAVGWFQKSAVLGYIGAHQKLAEIFLVGLLGQKDGVTGCFHAQVAAAGGSKDAYLWAGQCLEHGLGGRVDKAQALQWYRRAAAAGSESAQRQLTRLGVR